MRKGFVDLIFSIYRTLPREVSHAPANPNPIPHRNCNPNPSPQPQPLTPTPSPPQACDALEVMGVLRPGARYTGDIGEMYARCTRDVRERSALHLAHLSPAPALQASTASPSRSGYPHPIPNPNPDPNPNPGIDRFSIERIATELLNSFATTLASADNK